MGEEEREGDGDEDTEMIEESDWKSLDAEVWGACLSGDLTPSLITLLRRLVVAWFAILSFTSK